MKPHPFRIRRDKNAVPAEKMHCFAAFPKQDAASICAQKHLKRRIVCLEAYQITAAFRINQHTFNLKVFTAADKFRCASGHIFQNADLLLWGSAPFRIYNIHRFIDMQRSQIAVFIRTVIIIHTVGEIGTLLNFGN